MQTSFFFMFEFSQEHLAHSCRPVASFPRFPLYQGGPFLDWEKVLFESQPVFLHPASLQGHIQWDPAKQILKLGQGLLMH